MRLQGAVLPASEKDPDRWSAADKFTVVVETAGFNTTELSSYCRERGLFAEQADLPKGGPCNKALNSLAISGYYEDKRNRDLSPSKSFDNKNLAT